MKNSLYLFCLLIAVAFVNCKPKKTVTIGTPEVVELLTYKATNTRINNLVHTKLELEPDFEKKELKGTATITLKPHFYPTDSLTLNAKYMRIERVSIIYNQPKPATIESLQYTYDSLFLRIKLNKRYTKDESYTIKIEYIAQPEKCKSEGGTSITEDKGMYFINTDGKDAKKPIQIWTQGETEAASCWFPTIDAPNQKTTEEIIVTVPDKYRTISNGLMTASEKVGDNKRRDTWKQDKPHAPYLFALIVGDFVETKDKWRNINVNYYMEPAFAPYTKTVFGNTPKMLEFYSNVLGYPYPWPKFDQVVVRDFVSGAMENTGCVVHFDKLNHTNREHLDNTYEDVIAHELFHHWFGDLVTCESWSNIPLNESFATYGEYLWNEHMYGRGQADLKFNEFKSYYFSEAEEKQVELIRFYYDKRDELFDRHSYQKGGAVLHMLRKYVGDEAFFKSLNLYLTRNAYKNVEIHDLRMVFEEVTGEDLNWFFNQWFMGSGHPELEVKHQIYNGSGEIYGITVLQKYSQFKLPVDVDVYTAKGVERHRIIIENDSQTFGFSSSSKPLAVVFDAENQLLAAMTETKNIQAWEAQLKYAPLAAHKIKALNQLNELQNDREAKIKYNTAYLNDSFWMLRKTALDNLAAIELTDMEIKPFIAQIETISEKDLKSDVRVATIELLEQQGNEERLKQMLFDSSYSVIGSALSSLGNINKEAAFAYANKNREETNPNIQGSIFYAIGRFSPRDEVDFFTQKIESGDEQTYYNALYGLAYYITLNHTEKLDDALTALDRIATNKNTRGVESLQELRNFYSTQLYYLRYNKAMDPNKANKAKYDVRIKECEIAKKKVDAAILKHGGTLQEID